MMRLFATAVSLGVARADLELFRTLTQEGEFNGDVRAISFSGSTLAVGTVDGYASLYDWWTGEKRRDVYRCGDYDPGAPSEDRGPIYSAGLSGPPHLLALGTLEAVEIFDAATGEFKSKFEHGWSPVLDFAPESGPFAPEGGPNLAVGGRFKAVIFDVDTNEVLGEFVTQADSTVTFSPEGDRLLVGGSTDGVISVYDVATKEKLLEVDQETTIFFSATGHAAWSPDGTAFAAPREKVVDNDSSGRLAIYDAATGDVLQEVMEIDALNAVAYSPDGTTIAAAGGYDFLDESVIKLFDAATGELKQAIPKGGSEVYALAFSPDGSTLAAGEEAGVVSLYREPGATPPPTATLSPTPVATPYLLSAVIDRPYGGGNWNMRVAFDPKRDEIAVGDAHPVTVNRVSTGEVVHTLEDTEFVRSLAYSADASTFAVSGDFDWTSMVRLYDAASFDPEGDIEPTGRIDSVSLSSDGSLLAVGSATNTDGWRGRVDIYDSASLEVLRTLELPETATAVGRLLFAPASWQGSLLAVAGFPTDMWLKIFDAETGLVVTLADPADGFLIWDVGFSPESAKDIALLQSTDLAGSGTKITFYRASDFQAYDALEPDFVARHLSYGPDGMLAVAGYTDSDAGSDEDVGRAVIYDLATKTATRDFQGLCSRYPSDIAFSPEGDTLAIATNRVSLYARGGSGQIATTTPTAQPNADPTPRPTSESDGARTASVATAALLLAAWLA